MKTKLREYNNQTLLTLEMVNNIQDEAHKTYRKHQAGGIRGQMMTMYDMWDYHLIMATQQFMEQNSVLDRNEDGNED